MAVITFNGGATLRVPGTAAQVASALSAPRQGFAFAKFPNSSTRINPNQVAFISEDASAETEG